MEEGQSDPGEDGMVADSSCHQLLLARERRREGEKEGRREGGR